MSGSPPLRSEEALLPEPLPPCCNAAAAGGDAGWEAGGAAVLVKGWLSPSTGRGSDVRLKTSRGTPPVDGAPGSG